MSDYNISSVAASVAAMLSIDPPECASPAFKPLAEKKVERVLLYNPDAVALWIFEKYRAMFTEIENGADLVLPARSVMPSVTPVCFATMYTGASPDIHGIKKYEKPVVKTDTLFDALIRAGKKPCIISHGDASISKIFLERGMDYFIMDSVEECNALALKLMAKDEYDLITLYNGDYDGNMHRVGPEGEAAITALGKNIAEYNALCDAAADYWRLRSYAVGFCPDHGCHLIDGGAGSHGLDMEEDMNVIHLWTLSK